MGNGHVIFGARIVTNTQLVAGSIHPGTWPARVPAWAIGAMAMKGTGFCAARPCVDHTTRTSLKTSMMISKIAGWPLTPGIAYSVGR